MTNDNSKVMVRVENLKKHFPIKKGIFGQKQVGAVKAVDGVSFDIYQGETLGLVGESGCGKSTTGRTLLQLYKPTAGKVFYHDQDITDIKPEEMRQNRRNMQMIFQDPYASLNPRMTIRQIISEPLVVHGIGDRKDKSTQTKELINKVGLNPFFMDRYPHQFSGGQRQRVGIARALALRPEFIVCDEAISALDVSIQAQVVNLLEDLQKEFDLTYLFIAHDLSMVKHISDRVAVMYLGKLVELTERNELYENPLHPYTQALLSAVPIPDPIKEKQRNRVILTGDVPSPSHPPEGCNFNPRCPIAEDICRKEDPEWRMATPGHWVACHLVN